MITVGDKRIAKIFINGEEMDASFFGGEERLLYLFTDKKEITFTALDKSSYPIDVESNKNWEVSNK